MWGMILKPLMGVAIDGVKGFVETKKLKKEQKLAQIKAETSIIEKQIKGEMDWDIEGIIEMGVKIETQKALGKEFSIKSLVQEGVLLSDALSKQKVFPDMALSMLQIGEETGEMDKMLSKVADFYEDEVSTTTKALASLLEPLMIVFVGGIVGSILLAMYLPMFNVFSQLD